MRMSLFSFYIATTILRDCQLNTLWGSAPFQYPAGQLGCLSACEGSAGGASGEGKVKRFKARAKVTIATAEGLVSWHRGVGVS